MKFKQFLLTEGGAGGHLAHPFDILSPEDFLDFYDSLLQGKLESFEKIDGANLFIGIEKGKPVFIRNKNEFPSSDINTKFPLTHPGADAFRAGWLAIQEGFSKVSKKDLIKYHLINSDGSPNCFINSEVVYGTVPNIINYSDVNNFIVFHHYVGNPDDGYAPRNIDRKELVGLANLMGIVKIKADVINYYGGLKNVKTQIKSQSSTWVFKGSMVVPEESLKANLATVANKFRSYPEVKKIQQWRKLSKEELKETMESLTKKIGNNILMNITSNLFSGKRITPPEYPKIEGLVVNFKNNLIKITGDFKQYIDVLWEPINKGINEPIRKLNSYVLNDVLQIPNVVTIPKAAWKNANGSSKNFLITRNKKFYADTSKLTEKIDKKGINTAISNTFSELEKVYNNVAKGESIKKDDILKALRIMGYRLTQLEEKLTQINNRVELLDLYAREMFGVI
jgi:hypothetical protein